MKLQFKHPKFQADTAKAVVDVFAGQPHRTPTYMMDRGINYQQILTNEADLPAGATNISEALWGNNFGSFIVFVSGRNLISRIPSFFLRRKR